MKLRLNPEYEALYQSVRDAIYGAIEKERISAEHGEELRHQIMINLLDNFIFDEDDDETDW